MSGRGRGNGRGGQSFRLKVARMIPGQGTASGSQGNFLDHSSGVYEDMMLYVKNQPTKRRGRPKKLMPEPVFPKPQPQPLRNAHEVIYIPSMRRGQRQVVPVVARTSANPQPYVRNGPAVRGSRVQQHTIKCVIQSTVTRPSTNPLLAADAMKQKPQENQEFEWPDDLKELAATWDDLPESKLREVVKWFHTPYEPIPTTPLPKLVQNIHSLVNESDASLEEKIDEIGEIIEDLLKDAVRQPPKPLPKVVVEAQPIPMQHCGQWSSMAENQGNRES